MCKPSYSVTWYINKYETIGNVNIQEKAILDETEVFY